MECTAKSTLVRTFVVGKFTGVVFGFPKIYYNRLHPSVRSYLVTEWMTGGDLGSKLKDHA